MQLVDKYTAIAEELREAGDHRAAVMYYKQADSAREKAAKAGGGEHGLDDTGGLGSLREMAVRGAPQWKREGLGDEQREERRGGG